MEEEETEHTEGTPPLDISESLLSDACYICGYLSA